ncbi:hypothetical protein [Mycoplasmopsis arginini]|uniref:hypothetical protein n=1 Tax=Mycoplasmopsis arginini TaxID=2094 RepID=UPI003D032E8E
MKLQKKESNPWSVAGFILAFFLPLLGFIFSIIGFFKSPNYNSGKGLSIAGIIISLLIFFSAILITIASRR